MTSLPVPVSPISVMVTLVGARRATISSASVSSRHACSIIAGDTATVDDIIRIRAKLGLDQPVYIQFGEWVWRLLQGDLGISIFTNLPVMTLIRQRVEPTVS